MQYGERKTSISVTSQKTFSTKLTFHNIQHAFSVRKQLDLVNLAM